jgi:serine/threonine protein kinase
MLFEMLYGFTPFHSSNPSDLMTKGLKKDFKIPMDSRRDVSADCLELLETLLNYTPEERIRPVDILSHKFLTTASF